MHHKKIFFTALFLTVLILLVGYWKVLFVQTQQFIFGFDNFSYHSPSLIQNFSFIAPSLGTTTMSGYVYLPPGYQLNSTIKYPTIYLLHGDPGNYKDWVLNGNIQQTLDTLIANKTIQPVIVIMPDGNGPIIDAGQYLNADLATQNMEDYITNDLVTFIDTHYHTSIDPKLRALGGNSSGGYGALNIGLHHPEIFQVLFSLNGYTQPLNENRAQLLQPKSFEKNSVLRTLELLPNKKVPSIFMYYGNNDMFDFSRNVQVLYQKLVERNIPAQLLIDNGYHDWATWTMAIQPALLFVNKNFQM